jgi:hypothetical protein
MSVNVYQTTWRHILQYYYPTALYSSRTKFVVQYYEWFRQDTISDIKPQAVWRVKENMKSK